MSEQLRLEQEVIRLSQELDQAVAEKEQAAQYGLVLLEEKDSLEARCQVRNWFDIEMLLYLSTVVSTAYL